MLYLWTKALHIIFVFAWVAGLLVYPRYKLHQMTAVAGDIFFNRMRETSILLRRIIMTPSIIAVWVLGIMLVYLNDSYLNSAWLWAKLVLVVCLSAPHGMFISIGRRIDEQQKLPKAQTLRILSELPFVFLVLITVLVVVRPF